MEEKYQFTETQYHKAEQAAIRHLLDTVGTAKGKPTGIFVAAQPGAGKTGLAKSCLINFMQETGQEVAEFDPDVVGMYHPFYEEITKYETAQAFYHIQEFVRPASKTLNAIAMKRKNNILTQGTFRDTEGYLRIFEELKSNGYEIDVNLLAVDGLESLTSSMERFFKFLQTGVEARVVSTNPHNEAYKQMIATVREIERRGITDRIRVYRRGEEEFQPQLVYTKGDNRYRSATEALIEERAKDRRRVLANPEAFRARLDALRKNIAIYGRGEQIEQWEYLKSEFEKSIGQREQGE